ncbi:MAG: hypothetical protein LRS48_03660 [Desulfurococcales archaeon]|nr:hypothetical protein [Desulfurococcales archaeon]
MGRRRKRRKKTRKVVRLPSRNFQCPVCGEPTLTIDFKKLRPGVKLAVAKCGNCGLYCEFEVPENTERIDIYNRIVDLAYENRLDECKPKQVEEGEIEEVFEEEEIEVEDEEEE